MTFGWRRVLACVAATLTVAACGAESGTDHQDADSDRTTVTTSEVSLVAVCALLTDLVSVQSRTDGEDLESMRRQLPTMADLAADLVEIAPPQIRDDVRVLKDFIGEARRTVEDPDFVLDPDTLYIWETADTERAGAAIVSWADANCTDGIDNEALLPVTLELCLPDDADSDDVQALFDRTDQPSDTGTGVDLLNGIRSVAAGERSLEVELDALVSPERKAELLEILGAPPVVELVEGGGPCP